MDMPFAKAFVHKRDSYGIEFEFHALFESNAPRFL